MTTRWYIAKFIPDLRRFEPWNVGVIVFVGDDVAARFWGENATGFVDGRSVRPVGDLDGYRAWVDAWRYWASHRSAERDRSMLARRASDRFYLAEGGAILFGEGRESASEMAERLFAELVAQPTRSTDEREEVGDPTRLTPERVWERLVRHWARPDLADRFVPESVSSELNTERFEHVYRNGAIHVVHPLSLDQPGRAALQRATLPWSGRLRALRPGAARAGDKLIIDVVLGMPELDAPLRPQAEEVAHFLAEELGSVPGTRVVREADLSTYSKELEAEVAQHEAERSAE